MSETEKELRNIERKMKRTSKYLQKLGKRYQQADLANVLYNVDKYGLVFVERDFLDLHNLDAVEAQLYVPIVDGNPIREQSYVVARNRSYALPQLRYLQNNTDKDILLRIQRDRYTNQTMEEAIAATKYVIFDDFVIMRNQHFVKS